MKCRLVTAATAMVIGATSPMLAEAYPIDCAILLCLAGGFPSSVPCTQARAEMIRRITPWPIEPPLQLWRCPMRAAQLDPSPLGFLPVALARSSPGAAHSSSPAVFRRNAPSVRHAGTDRDSIASVQGSEIDIGHDAFDFLRSIRVFDVARLSQRWSGGESSTCHQLQDIRVGTYDERGTLRWASAQVVDLPASFDSAEGWQGLTNAGSGASCLQMSVRAAFLEWRDHAGNYDFEQVAY